MKDTPSHARSQSTLLLALLATVGCHTAGTSQAPGQTAPGQTTAERFDLVVYGFDFDPAEHEVFLRTNLDFGAEWVSLGTLDPNSRGSRGDDDWATVVFPELSTERFLGQDFRESYLDLRIVTRDGSDGSSVSAFYAMPHAPNVQQRAPEIRRAIESDPLTVAGRSIARHVQPRPHPLRPGMEYIEHVRAPMHDALPGVMEVEQLQVEWRNRDG